MINITINKKIKTRLDARILESRNKRDIHLAQFRIENNTTPNQSPELLKNSVENVVEKKKTSKTSLDSVEILKKTDNEVSDRKLRPRTKDVQYAENTPKQDWFDFRMMLIGWKDGPRKNITRHGTL